VFKGIDRQRSHSTSTLTQLGDSDTDLSERSSAVDLQASYSQVRRASQQSIIICNLLMLVNYLVLNLSWSFLNLNGQQI